MTHPLFLSRTTTTRRRRIILSVFRLRILLPHIYCYIFVWTEFFQVRQVSQPIDNSSISIPPPKCDYSPFSEDTRNMCRTSAVKKISGQTRFFAPLSYMCVDTICTYIFFKMARVRFFRIALRNILLLIDLWPISRLLVYESIPTLHQL